MASNGIKRLKDKHVKKKAEMDKLNALLEELMPSESPTKEDENPEPAEKPKRKRTTRTAKSPEIPHLKTLEQEYFERLWNKLVETHDNPEHYRLVAENAAKMLAQMKRLEDQMEQDGGPILATEMGRLYPHPAMKIIQNFQGQILTYMKALGLTHQTKPGPKKQEESATSIFAQFQ